MADKIDTFAPLRREEEVRARAFIVRLCLMLAAFVLAAVALNGIVDPHGLHRWMELDGTNRLKPRANQSPEAFKYRSIDVLTPRSLLLGNSRVEMGWDPQDLPRERFGAVVNAAVPGSGLETMIALTDHAWIRSRPAHLLVGLEFFDCLAKGPRPAAGEAMPSAWSSNQDPTTFFLRRTRAALEDLLSLDTAADSITTLLLQRSPDAAHVRNDGFQTARDYPAIARIDGVRKMFVQRESETIRIRLGGPRSVRYEDGSPSTCFDALETLLARAGVRQQTVLLATYPYHARLLEIIAQAGFEPAYEDWKRELTRIVDRARSAGVSVELRDFGGYHAYAREPIARPGRPERVMQWYWESGHFKASLGARMLGVMTGAEPSQAGFGEVMTTASIETLLARSRATREAFVAEQPEVVEEIGAAISRSR